MLVLPIPAPGEFDIPLGVPVPVPLLAPEEAPPVAPEDAPPPALPPPLPPPPPPPPWAFAVPIAARPAMATTAAIICIDLFMWLLLPKKTSGRNVALNQGVPGVAAPEGAEARNERSAPADRGETNFDAPWARPLLLRTQPLEALDKLANRRRASRSGKTRREVVLAPDHGVLTAGVVRPLKHSRATLEVGNCIGALPHALGWHLVSQIFQEAGAASVPVVAVGVAFVWLLTPLYLGHRQRVFEEQTSAAGTSPELSAAFRARTLFVANCPANARREVPFSNGRELYRIQSRSYHAKSRDHWISGSFPPPESTKKAPVIGVFIEGDAADPQLNTQICRPKGPLCKHQSLANRLVCRGAGLKFKTSTTLYVFRN
jgi:hypothetical protein